MKLTNPLAHKSSSRNALLITTLVSAGVAIVAAVLARRAERANPPIGQTMVVDGVQLHYIDRGTGPAVVLIHGNGVRLQDYIASGLVDRLSATHRVIAFDRPGYGFSERPRNRLWGAATQARLLLQALRQLGVERPVVLGHSFGTMVAVAMALESPADVSRLVLIGGYYYATARLDVVPMVPAAVPLLGDVLRYTVMPISSRVMLRPGVHAMFAPMPVPENFLPTLSGEMMVRPGQLRANAEDAVAMIPDAFAMQKRYGELTMPVSIFAGQEDMVVDHEAHSERLHRELPQSTLVVAPGAGHMVHYTIADQIERAVDSVPATAALAA